MAADYMAWVHTQPCCARHLGKCRGPIEADHTGRSRGLGQKASGDTCIPLCHLHHMCRTSFSGHFRGWDQKQMRAWLYESWMRTRCLYHMDKLRNA